MRNIQSHLERPTLILGALIAICISLLLPVQAQCPATQTSFKPACSNRPSPEKS